MDMYWYNELLLLSNFNDFSIDLNIIKYVDKSKILNDFYVNEQTEEQCIDIIKKCPLMLIFVKNKTYNICKTAIELDGALLNIINSENLEVEFYKKLCEISVLKTNFSIKNVNYMKTGIIFYEKLCNMLIDNNMVCINYIKDEIININIYKKLCETSVKNNGYNLQYIKKEKLDLEFYKKLCEIACSTNLHALDYVKEFEKDDIEFYKKLCKISVKIDIYSCKYINNLEIFKELYKENNNILINISPFLHDVITDNKKIIDLFQNIIHVNDMICNICYEDRSLFTHYVCNEKHILCLNCWVFYILSNNETCCYCRKKKSLTNNTKLFIKK